MKMYQLSEVIGNDAGASNKARSDVKNIAEKFGFTTCVVNTTFKNGKIKSLNKIPYLCNLKRVLFSVDKNSILLVQIPILNLANISHSIIRKYCKKKNIKIICVIHDVNEIRLNLPPESNSAFYNLLKEAKAVVSHNEKMTEYLIERGITKEKIVNLEVFDYLLDFQEKDICFSKKINIAGNLDSEKVGYISYINSIENVNFELYGPNYDEKCGGRNINYNGIVNSNELPHLLNKGFGLVWDGDSIQTCSGNFGKYLMYNNPHKLSLYLAAGIPVVIWSQAAEADFVKRNNVGIVINSLLELPDALSQMDVEKYNNMLDNVKRVRYDIVSGRFLTAALREILYKK